MSQVDLTQPPVKPANHEWQGSLGRATASNALFSLYLAMQMQPGNEPAGRFTQDAEATVTDTELLTRLNHYRRAPLAFESQHLPAAKINSQLVASQDTAGLSLWQAMHPEPLASKNNPAYLEPEIVANCSLATQVYLKQSRPAATQHCDASLMSDIIEGSGSLLQA
ncbi:hypothetical protein IT774_08375 [Salinimonas marina]|uniref:QueD like 2 n=1 Tax=Salinimonas marina TaxID=2785918 RepID=A0A7S9DUS4_9ALTE|nr:VC2046/SO_2500 family protein [Salinimonas marina]QPG04301.1 hypothetical protein IT774_08375 [Salinimonas marina]